MKTSTKRFLFLLIVMSFVIPIFSQAPTWQWAKRAGGTDSENAIDNCTDASGNLYVVGYFKSANINFGTGLLINASPTVEEVYIVKYDSLGTTLWAKRFGGSGNDRATGVKTDATGNVYVTGNFGTPSMVVGTTTLSNGGAGTAVFIVKYDPSGNVLWAKSISGNGNVTCVGISAEATGDTYVSGFAATTMLTIGTFTSSATGFYIAKFDVSGNAVWAKVGTGGSNAFSSGLAADGLGNVYVTGNFQGPSCTFGAITLNNSSTTTNDVFLTKYNATNGNVIWAKSGNGSGDDGATGICVDNAGNVIVVGFFASTSFTMVGTATNFGPAGTEDVFVAKFSSAGIGQGQYQSNQGLSNERAQKVTTDVGGKIYVTGYTHSTILGFPSAISMSNPSGTTYNDVFVLKFDGTTYLGKWVIGAGGNFNDIGWAITSSPGGNIYVAGSFESNTIAFGTTTLTNINPGVGLRDVFVSKLYNCLSAPAQPSSIIGNTATCLGSPETYSVNAVAGATGYTWTKPGGWTGASTTNILNAASGTNGNIVVTVQNACGSSPTRTLGVVVNPLPVITVSTSNTLICAGQTVTLTAGGALSYTWTPGGPGATIVDTPTATTSYFVNGTDANGCTGSGSIAQFVNTCTGVNQISNSVSQLNIYPNPFNNKIIIEGEMKQALQIFNAIGTLIFSSTTEVEKTEIDLSNQPSGIYFIKVGTITKKIIKE